VDVCLLQETHITETSQSDWLCLNKGLCFFSNLSSVSAGVAFMLRPGFVPDSYSFLEIVKGHLASLEFVYQGFHLTLLNVYAPSESGARKEFFTHLANYFHTLVFDHCICIGGDFNCTFEPNLDRNTPEPHPESHKHISRCFSSLGLLDAWRMQHRTASQYTWCRCANGLITLARLDRWYINSSLPFFLIITW